MQYLPQSDQYAFEENFFNFFLNLVFKKINPFLSSKNISIQYKIYSLENAEVTI